MRSMGFRAFATLLSSHLQMRWLFQEKHLGMASAQTSQLHCTYTDWIRLAEALACQSSIWPCADWLVRGNAPANTVEGALLLSIACSPAERYLPLLIHSHQNLSLIMQRAHYGNWLDLVHISFLRIFPHQHQPQTCRQPLNFKMR